MYGTAKRLAGSANASYLRRGAERGSTASGADWSGGTGSVTGRCGDSKPIEFDGIRIRIMIIMIAYPLQM